MSLSRKLAQLLDSSGNVLASKLANAQAFAAGTKMIFAQTTSPTGWTKQTTTDDAALRVVSGTAGSGGSSGFASVFASRTPSGTLSNTTATNQSTTASGSVGSTSLSVGQMPYHRHFSGAYYMDDFNASNYMGVQDGDNYYSPLYTDYQGANEAHNHSLSINGHSHTQDAHGHTFTGAAMDFAVKYLDTIVATKD